MKEKSRLRRFWEHKRVQPISVLLDWFLEVLVFVLLPLVIYLLCFVFLEKPLSEIILLPEWMFFSIVLWGDTCKKLLVFYRRFKGFEIKVVRSVATTLLGVSVSVTALIFSIICQYSETMETPALLGPVQMVIFLLTFFIAGFLHWWIKTESEDFTLHSHLIKEGEEE